MTTNTSSDGTPPAESSWVVANRSGPMRTGLRALVLLLVSAGAIFWAGRTWWLNNHPVQAAALGLRSGDPAERVAAIRRLWDLGNAGTAASAEVIDALIPALKDPDAGVRTTGTEALGVVGPYAVTSGTYPQGPGAVVTVLVGALKDSEPGVRAAAASALAGFLTSSRPNSSGRGASKAPAKGASSASAIDTDQVTSRLFDLVGDPDTTVRRAALTAIRQAAPKREGDPPQALFSALEDPSATTWATAVSTLVTFSHGLDPLVPALLRRAEQDEQSVRDACTQALGEIRPSALTAAVIPELIAGLKSPDRDVRLRLASLLGRMSPDPRRAVPALIQVLREPMDSDRDAGGGTAMTISYEGPAQEAAEALGRIAPKTPAAGEAIAALTEVVRSGPPKRRAAAAEALGQFGPAAAPAAPAVVSLLQAALAGKKSTDDGTAAAATLGKIAPGTPSAPTAVTALTAALDSPFMSTRRAGMRALGSFGPAAAGSIAKVRSIQEKDLDPPMRKAAASALKLLEAKAK